MEDVDICFERVNIGGTSSVSIFGVLDGHGGVECARYGTNFLNFYFQYLQMLGRIYSAHYNVEYDI